MSRRRVLFQGSHSSRGREESTGRNDSPEQLKIAQAVAHELGEALIRAGFDLILTGSTSLDSTVGLSAVATCRELGVDPRERIRTYPHGRRAKHSEGFGMILEPMDRRYQEVRTFVVSEADAVIAVLGGKGTSDCVQKAVLAGRPVFPIAVAGGAAQEEWKRLKQSGYANQERGDLDFLADRSADAPNMARRVVDSCASALRTDALQFSNRIFIIHGHDAALKSELARFLERLQLQPVILHEQPDQGKTVLSKLRAELKDVGYAFAILTPDDVASPADKPGEKRMRARQNVVFEHGMLVGLLGPDRVCAILRGEIEIPSDLSGILYKHVGEGQSIQSIGLELVKELKSAGYDLDANKL